MNRYKWFLKDVQKKEIPPISFFLLEAGFVQAQDAFIDKQDRHVVVSDETDQIKIGIPVSDFISEQEQLEFVMGVLALEIGDIEMI